MSTPNTTAPVTPATGRLAPIGVPHVRIERGFWADLQALNSAAIIPHAVGWVDRLGWSTNLVDAAADARYDHRGREFADSEIYKLVEAMSWDRARTGDPALHDALDRFVEVVAGAQEPDGYLHTLFGRPWQRPRYSDFQWGHELYCFGHLIQAAVAHHRSTGSSRLLEVATRIGDHVCTMFGPAGLQKVCGHAEIETALVELHRETGVQRYLDQAVVFIERRGTGTLPLFEFGAEYWQDDMPVRAAEVLRGHAVRALYLAAGAVDAAVERGDTELLTALERQWEHTIARRTYVTGGMGSHHMNEGFGLDFVLPPDRSYCETCAGVASIMFSWRLLLATGEAKYGDLIERTLFNVVATSPSADGQAFFYANTLHQRVSHTAPALNADGVAIRGGAAGRQAWYEVSCCPPNVARTLASLGAYMATSDATGVQLHQYAESTIEARLADGPVRLAVHTAFPADGTIRVDVLDAPSTGTRLRLRAPEWSAASLLTTAAGTRRVAAGSVGTEVLHAGAQVVLELDMTPTASRPDRRIDAMRGTVVVQRGPEVYCLESIDLPDGWPLDDVVVDPGTAPRYDGKTVRIRAALLEPEPIPAWSFSTDRAPSRATDCHEIPLVRYHSWAERGPSTMRVGIPTKT